jgi:uncharacterized protein YlxW (UPF0749 family)
MGAPRLTRANLLAGLLTVALGFAIATQIQQNSTAGLQTLRQDELVRVLDDVSQRVARLDQQRRDLETQRDVLKSGANSSEAAVAQAQTRLDQLAILAGTVPAVGPGIRLTITDPNGAIHAALLLDVLQELRDAGAEVVQFGAVRIVAESAFSDAGSAVTIDGQPLNRPFVVLAIGNPQTLASALNIPGGIVNTVARAGATATVDQLDRVAVDALHAPRTPRYAQPAAEPTPAPTRP